MTHIDAGGCASALVLVEEAQLRGDGARESEQDAQLKRHEIQCG
jgi:hypothetical protein